MDLSLLEAQTGTQIGVAMHDVASGRWCRWRADERFAYCSTFKLFLAGAILERSQTGAYNLDRSVVVQSSDIVAHSPIAAPMVGSALKIRELVEAIVTASDNAAANILIRELGGLDALRTWYRELGDRTTSIDRLEPALNLSAPVDTKDTTTPQQTVANLVYLFETERLTPPSRELLLGWLRNNPAGLGRLKAAVPQGFRVAHKTGTGPDGPVNDIGIIYPPDRLPVYAAVYVHSADLASTVAGERVLAEAARRALGSIEAFWRT